MTITTADMTRFLLTLDDAVDTIFAAVRSGAPRRDLHPALPERADDRPRGRPHRRPPIETVITGIRPGEKIHEILISEEEATRTVHGARGLLRGPPDASRTGRSGRNAGAGRRVQLRKDADEAGRARRLPRARSPRWSASDIWRPR